MALNYTSDRPTFPEPHLHVSTLFSFFLSLAPSVSLCLLYVPLSDPVFRFSFSLSHTFTNTLVSWPLPHSFYISFSLSQYMHLSL